MLEVYDLTCNTVLFVVPSQVRRNAPLLCPCSVAGQEIFPVGVVQVHHDWHLVFVLILHSLIQSGIVNRSRPFHGLLVFLSIVEEELFEGLLHFNGECVVVLAHHFLTQADSFGNIVLNAENN